MLATKKVSDLLDRAVRVFPDRPAVLARDITWTYRELGHRVVAAAEQLTANGAFPSRVAIVGANSPAYVVAYFAAQAIGATTVEVGHDESLDALVGVMRVADPHVVVTDRYDLAGALPSHVTVFTFNELLEVVDDAPEATDLDAIERRDADEAAVVFTSGTTGSPKGVVLTHDSILFVVRSVCEYLGLGPDDRRSLVLPLCHTYGKNNLLSAVMAGASIALLEPFSDYAGFFNRIARDRCTVLSVVPFHLNVIARRGIPDDCDVSSVRAITTSGAPLSPEVADAIVELFPSASLYSMYGLTEASTRVAFLPPELIAVKRGSVGRPLPGVVVQILSDGGSLLPPGSVGNVVVHGPNVMRGYLGDPELTAQTLIGGGLFTGDLGRLDDDGFLYLEGRRKDIIKVAGERISPVEIERVLMAHPAIADAAAIGLEDPLLDEAVCAFVVLRKGERTPSDLPQFCAARLSHHKRPRRFHYIDAIPRTPTGKIRRHLLKKDAERA